MGASRPGFVRRLCGRVFAVAIAAVLGAAAASATDAGKTGAGGAGAVLDGLGLPGFGNVATSTARRSTPSGASAWAETEQTRVRLIAAAEAVGTAREITVGLHFRMTEGWKVYWRSPGAAGFPPQLDWSGSGNLAGTEMRWPAPKRFSVLGLDTMGYSDEVVFPIRVALAEPGRATALRTRVDYLTCKEICIPYTAELALDLPEGAPRPTRFAHLIDRYNQRVPGDGAALGLAIETVEVVETGEGQALRVEARAREPFAEPDLFVEGPDLVEFMAPKVELREGGRRAVLLLPAATPGTEMPPLDGVPLTLTLVDGARAMETTMVPTIAESSLAGDWGRLAVILALAVLGGLILNLMPCVLPVLSIKLLHLVRQGGAERGHVRRGFLASAAGIVFSFLVLAGILSGLKAAGVVIGWGIQFQQPVFLVAMTVVLTLFAANLWGLFEIRLPGSVADAAVRTEMAVERKSGLWSHFLTGAFATLLATPCSAPFLGTAVGFALARGTGETFAVFLALGAGLALPYVLVAAFPGIATRMPRPGPWMVRLKAVLGFALAGTAFWLITVLEALEGPEGAALTGVLMVAVVLALWLRRRLPERMRWAGGAAVAVLALLAFATPGRVSTTAGDETAATADDGTWQAFERDAIPGLVAAGRVVFVDVTADWCITCQANKRLVLDQGEVAERLRSPEVVAMLADWTRPSTVIADYLAGYGRYGIPFYAVYGPGAPKGRVLPEILSQEIVLEALAAAAGGPGTAR